MSNDYGRGSPYPTDNTQRMNQQPEQPGYWQPPTYAEALPPYAAPAPMPDNIKPVPYVQPQAQYGTPVQQYPSPVQPSYQPNIAPASIGYDPNETLRREAEKRVKDREGFQTHFRTYLFVIGLQIAIWTIISITSGGAIYFWPIWPAFGWGIGIFAHYMSVYNNNQPSAAQRERQIQAEMQRLAGRGGYQTLPPGTPTAQSMEQQAQQEWQQRYEANQRQQGNDRR